LQLFQGRLIKEQIAYLKLWLGILVVTDISLVGWFISNISTTSIELFYAALIGIIFVTFGIIIIHKRIEHHIESLKEH
jgi:hypothetical protein